MSNLIHLLPYLDNGAFDCIEFGSAAQPGHIEGALRVRLAPDDLPYQVSITSMQGDEVLLSQQFNAQSLESALTSFTLPLLQRNPGTALQYFGVSRRRSRR